MVAAIALLMVTSGAGLVAGQGPPPGTTVEAQAGWALTVLGVLGLVVAATLSDRADRRIDRAAARGDGPAWFWAPLEERPEPAPAAVSSAVSAGPGRSGVLGPRVPTWRFRVPTLS